MQWSLFLLRYDSISYSKKHTHSVVRSFENSIQNVNSFIFEELLNECRWLKSIKRIRMRSKKLRQTEVTNKSKCASVRHRRNVNSSAFVNTTLEVTR
jgi:hypothetical protein